MGLEYAHKEQMKTHSIATYRNGISESEQALQAHLIEWVELHKHRFPELQLLYAIPNAAKRGKVNGWVMKLTGTKRGVPDLHLPVQSRDKQYIGMWIEMKSKRGVVSPEQRQWLDMLATAGHKTVIHRSWTDAVNTIIDYLELDTEKL